MKLRGCAITSLIRLATTSKENFYIQECWALFFIDGMCPELAISVAPPLVLHFPGPTGNVRNQCPLDGLLLPIATAGCCHCQSFLCSCPPGDELWRCELQGVLLPPSPFPTSFSEATLSCNAAAWCFFFPVLLCRSRVSPGKNDPPVWDQKGLGQQGELLQWTSGEHVLQHTSSGQTYIYWCWYQQTGAGYSALGEFLLRDLGCAVHHR